jgi:hypothetical protein
MLQHFLSQLPDTSELQGFLVWLFVGSPQVAAWATLLSMVVLYYYTRYTRRMMLATEATMRSAQRPLVQAVDVERDGERVTIHIHNAGAGPALHLSRWIARRSTSAHDIPRRPGFIPISNYRDEHSSVEVLASRAEERIDFQHRVASGRDWEEVLLVIHAEDVSGNKYQNAVKLRLSDAENRIVWQSLSEQLWDEHKEENAFIQWLMRARRKIEQTVTTKR